MPRLKIVLRVSVYVFGAIAIGLLGWRIGRMQNSVAKQLGDQVGQPDYGAVADFTFTNQNGKKVGLKELKDGIWIADFIFTRCMGPCPLLTTRMATLQGELKDVPGLSFVSFTVDPDHDTPEVLAKYAKNYGADLERWHFLTGPKGKIYELIRTSFHLAVEPQPGQTPSVTDILHSTFFVIVDRNGKVRGYINTDEEGWSDKIKNQIHALTNS